ncbi:MAG: tRNA pseudouridine(13) synthase TruD [Woeseiaceae bacterium]|nr:tRNA pseudouridine(13) synthase TruD [Woeseiaceae bacterium]
MADMPDWARAHGEPLFTGRIRERPQDFIVDEELGFAPSGDGEHDLLRIRKTSANTAWVARQLAAFAGIPARDVGYCGLKDRHAVTSQWFSVRRIGTNDWDAFEASGVEVIEVLAHRKKLRRGSHRGNAFRIALRPTADVPPVPVVEERLKAVERHGVPNYFGEQRFGRGGSNIALAERLFAGQRMKRDKRSIALSAARSFLFNAILDRRVRDGSWDAALPGELVNLDGSRSVFSAGEEDLADRLSALDVHPTASLWGRGAPLADDVARALEREIVGEFPALVEGLEQAGVDAGHRPTRVRVQDLEWSASDNVLAVTFTLPSGAFATSVLREIATVVDAQTVSSST